MRFAPWLNRCRPSKTRENTSSKKAAKKRAAKKQQMWVCWVCECVMWGEKCVRGNCFSFPLTNNSRVAMFYCDVVHTLTHVWHIWGAEPPKFAFFRIFGIILAKVFSKCRKKWIFEKFLAKNLKESKLKWIFSGNLEKVKRIFEDFSVVRLLCKFAVQFPVQFYLLQSSASFSGKFWMKESFLEEKLLRKLGESLRKVWNSFLINFYWFCCVFIGIWLFYGFFGFLTVFLGFNGFSWFNGF